MQHPLAFVPVESRKRFFFLFLALTCLFFIVFRILDEPLRSAAAPNGIVSFEMARTSENASEILASWAPMKGTDMWEKREKLLFAAFGLGLDYLFMPTYALALAFGTLLVAQKHAGWLRSGGVVAGYAAFLAPLFDAVENFALFQVLRGAYASAYPAIAAYCATIKFGLLVLGLVIALLGWILPKK